MVHWMVHRRFYVKNLFSMYHEKEEYMAKTPVPLNETKIKSLKPKDKNYSTSDGNGLQLLVKTNGSKLWEFRYTSPVFT